MCRREYKFQVQSFWLWKLWLANLFDAPIEVRLRFLERCSALRVHASGMPQMPYSCYHTALALIDVDAQHEEVKQPCVDTLSGYAESAPMNYKGMELHLRAELEQDIIKRLEYYNQAIEHAEAAHHLHLSG